MSRTFRLLFLLLLVFAASARAQQFSYVYIQGDKQTPFYVKLNGEMQPRYGKNYCILPQLEAGTIKIQILFQQNVYPAQTFTIQVPENGNRAFMLTRRQQDFSLYDLQQRFYLTAGNAEGDDHLPAAVAVAVNNQPISAIEPDIPEPIVVRKKERVKEQSEEEETPRSEKPARIRKPLISKPIRRDRPTENTASNNGNDPQFLDNVKLPNQHDEVTNDPLSNSSSDTVFTQKKPLDITFHNSDCPQPMADKDFERIYKNMVEKPADEDRIEYLNGQLDKCYQTWQARTLGTLLTEDAARYTFLKNIYPRITDQQAFPLLDDMLRSDVWKTQFAQLTHH